MDQDQQNAILDATFFQWGREREADITNGVKFAHYTSAQVAMDIFRARDENRCLWLRNAMLMNDFSEIEYGQQLLRLSLNNQDIVERLKAACNAINTDVINAFTMLDQEVYAIKRGTYLLSLALHKGLELVRGRLSMWRAYGGDANVCLLLNPEAFVTEQTAYDAALAPVDYGGPEKFLHGLIQIIENMERNCAELREINPDLVKANLKYAIDVMVLSTKHPGFQEESEWRVIHREKVPAQPNSPPSKIVCLNGIVQKVFYIPMKNMPEHNLQNADLNSLLYKVLIGPTPNPDLVWEGFVRILDECGVENPADKVLASGIPLRR
ncbi:DUF2971 domain-containing protein [Sphingomonas sp. R1]|uniref:DUF2971 domain-containing protein n=1 Tax=Sphingomonas sp. R1 TaxID=399176 RepID=UPI002224FE26|nr:DUF2971 domain-containing protein [Sphingomonas sp. R1]UYY78211.1 DUF2971 domain-containing protein [Sphingomonas sp. R1]